MNKITVDEVEYVEVAMVEGKELYNRWRVGQWVVMEILNNGMSERKWFKKK